MTPESTVGDRKSRSSKRLALVGSVLVALGFATGTPRSAAAISSPGTASNFTLVGHNSLADRGVNAAGAIYGNYEYVGSRSDGSHANSGVQIVDISNPANPTVVGQIPLPSDITTGYTSRELRVWPQQGMLLVVYFGCSAILHACASGSDTGAQPFQRINFFDVSGTNGANPVLVTTYKPSTTPHELFLWTDPLRPARALLYFTSPNNSTKSLVVTDISDWRHGNFPEIASFSVVSLFSSSDQSTYDVRLHSISVSPDGTRTYFAHLGGGVLVVDSTDLANNVPNPQFHLLTTPISGRAFWDNQGAHSSVKIPGKPYILTTEEIYGKGVALNDAFGAALGGCPWGWVRIIDSSNPAHLQIVSEYKIDENQQSFCSTLSSTSTQENFSSYASHNPTVLPDVAILTWHSGGLQAINLSDPIHPTQAGFFLPTPDTLQVGQVHTQDPALEPGSNGVIGWSYPIIRNGLIYYIDIANGLYIVRYSGPHADEVAGVSFLEGNSSLGDALRLEPGLSIPETPALWLLLTAGAVAAATATAVRRRRQHGRSRASIAAVAKGE
jgi:hypothetical protein